MVNRRCCARRGSCFGVGFGLQNGHLGSMAQERYLGVMTSPGSACLESVSSQLCPAASQVLDRACQISIEDLGVSAQERQAASTGSGDREAVAERDRSTCLQARGLDHQRSAGQIQLEGLAQPGEHVVCFGAAVVALDPVVDLYGVHPAHQRPVADELLDAVVRGLLAI
jgi:hypothetical protein